MKEEADPSEGWNDLYASTGSRAVLRYRKGVRTRTYQLRVQPNHSRELWVNSEGGGSEPKSRRLMILTNPHDAAALLESVEQELRAGGWTEA